MKRVLALTLCLCLLLSGCSGNYPQPHTPTGDALESDNEPTAPHILEADPEGVPLVMAYYQDITMNPYKCTDFTNRALFSLLYQGLFSIDRSYNVIPQLCKNYRVSRDMRTYTFYIEQATFSDNTYVTAEDVVASLHAAWESPYYSGRFTYFNTIELSEDGGITISLHTPYENLPLLLDIPILKKDQLESDRPLGTGPYVLYDGLNGGTLRKRLNWWASGSGLFSQDSIKLVAAQSATHIRDNFEFYDVSLVCADPGSDRYVDYRCDYELWDCENGMFTYLGCSASSDVFASPEMRAALTYAIDRDTLVKDYYRGFARSASLPCSPLSPYYSQALASKYAYDPEKFAQAVQDAGLTGAKTTLLVNSDDSLRVRVARSIAKMLEEGGLVVTMKEVSGQEYNDALLMRVFDLYLGQTKLSPNMDLTPFFSIYRELSQGGLFDDDLLHLCQQALENHGNYYTLHKAVMDNSRLCPVLIGSYSIYATRGMLTELSPARDNLFSYTLGKPWTVSFWNLPLGNLPTGNN